jgi:hypothetical protein
MVTKIKQKLDVAMVQKLDTQIKGGSFAGCLIIF